MSKKKVKDNRVIIEVVAGVEGPSLYIGDDCSGHRLAGPKPWGGGQTIHSFKVDPEELMRELKGLMGVNP